MSQILQDVENEKTRNFYIKRAQHVLKKLDTPLDNYAFFITNFNDVIYNSYQKQKQIQVYMFMV